MKIASGHKSIELWKGDCLEEIKNLPDNSIDSVVTDPPYALVSIVKRFGKKNSAPAKFGKDGAFARASKGFMGKEWDTGDVAFKPEIWTETLRVLKPGGYLLSFGGTRTYHRVTSAIEDAGFEIRDCIMWIYGQGFPKSHKQENGWGTALKPAVEPIVLARKPLSETTVKKNIEKWGTGAINIDGCRVPNETGRFPANVIHDGSNEVTSLFPDSKAGVDKGERGTGGIWQKSSGIPCGPQYGDDGSASRFFYCVKASPIDKVPGSTHPTQKPVNLMRYLVRLVTPLHGVTLDPFAGTGTTGQAAILESCRAILIEREKEYIPDIQKRLQMKEPTTKSKPLKKLSKTNSLFSAQ